METQGREQILTAIRQLGRRVTASDVAVKTGLSVNDARRALNTIASDTKATLAVSQEGRIAYCFAAGFESFYARQGLMAVLETAGNAIFALGFYLLKLCFGLALVFSFLTVVALIGMVVYFVIKLMSEAGDTGGDGMNLDWIDVTDITNFFTWDNARGVAEEYYYTRVHNAEWDEKPDQGFLLNCYSFLFGDGNPNRDFEELKWQSIGEKIRKHHGVITSEELAPLTGADPDDEDAVLPALVRFDGAPEVTETGNIVYVFPTLQESAFNQKQAAHHRLSLIISDENFPQGYAEEQQWPFTNQPVEALLPVVMFAALNFSGAMWLLNMTTKLEFLVKYAPILQALTIYGGLFLVFPIIRKIGLDVINAGIEVRNKKRAANAQLLANPSPALIEKLDETQAFYQGAAMVPETNLAYRSDQDIADQNFPDELVERFEREIKQPGNSEEQQ